ncbi:TetR/AcrR family transcriptional regulator [Amycolatopsis sp. CA-230715]|uniref:TetR/AcrR family transcriptional regulator n=1 Tax=Amycolatopsis sp. CA-230715 TaxID=2745196 RepID=UPI001C036146|nr:TetR/AcrR family transcriptional regulator [Amycolatopsis sp. CA-230715]QWF84671.1 HTH-type transcriptional repressor FabR [Amycolatopsis sp. CA-230715]
MVPVPDEEDKATHRTRNRWGEGDRLRGEILDAASRLLSELGGEDGLTIRGVARAVGIAPASIYQHFTDRNALVTGLMRHEFARLRELMAEADAKTDPEDVVGRVRAQLYAYCAFAVDNPGHYRLMLSSSAARPTSAARPEGPMVDVIDTVAEGLARCDEAGHKLRLPSDRAAVMVFVGVHGRVALLHSSPSERGRKRLIPFVDELVSLVFD